MEFHSQQIFCLSFLIFFVLLRADHRIDFAESLKVFIDYLNKPSKLTVMTCWNFDVRRNFAKRFLNKTSKQAKTYYLSMVDADIKSLINIPEENHLIIIVDLNCSSTRSLLKNVTFELRQNIKWIILDLSYNETKIKNIFSSLPILVNTEFYCIFRTTIDRFDIKMVYRISKKDNLIIENFGEYLNGTLYDQRTNKVISIRRRNLKKFNLRATLVITNNDSLNHLTDYRDRHIDTISKVCYLLTNFLVDYVNGNLTYTFEKSWGYKNQTTGTWNGMIGDLTQNKADIGASALFFTPDRIACIDYIAMTTPTRSKFVFHSPKLSFTDNVYLLPFDENLWYSLIGLIAVTSILLLASTWLEWRAPLVENAHEIQDSTLLKPSILDTVSLVFGASCQQGSSVCPKSLTARIIMIITFTILMFLYTCYSANIVSLLQSPSNRIKTLNDLLESRLTLGVDDTVFNRYYFPHATEYVRQEIYKRKILNKDGTDNFMSLEYGIKKIRHELFAFHMEIGVGYKVVEETFYEHEKCGLKEIQYLQVVDPWYSIQKNSSFKEIFKIGMMRIHEHGLQERENSKMYTKKPKCVGSGGNFITVGLIDTKPAGLILLWGYLLSVIILGLEIIFKNAKIKITRYLRMKKYT